MPEFASPMLRRWELGNALRHLREERGMTIADATAAMKERYGSSFSTTKLSRLETAKRGVIPRDVHDLCVLYGVSENQRDHLVELAKGSREPERFQPDDDTRGYQWYIELEQIAVRLREFTTMFMPGLLQTAEYAMVVESLTLKSPVYYYHDLPTEDLPRTAEGRANLRLERQKLLEQDNALELHAIIDENAFHRRLREPGVMEAQLRYLLDASTRPNVRVQVVPFSAGLYPGAEASYWSILDFPPGDHYPRRTAYVETPTGARVLDHQADVARIDDAYATITRLALSPEGSRALIKKVIKDLYSH